MVTPRILVVEDERITAMSLQCQLRALGYDVPALATSGPDAIRKAEETCPNLVLMDIRLDRGMDGVEAARQIRSRFGIPVIYLTAYSNQDILERAKVTEPYGYVLKPYEERELKIVIEMALYRHEMERKLREREQWFAATLRSIGDGVIATDREGRITFLNPAAEHLIGWSREEVQGRSVAEVFRIIHDETRQVIDSPLAKALRERVSVPLANHAVLVAKNNEERPIDDCASTIIDDGGTPLGGVLVFRDVTERKRLQESLQQQAKDLAEANRHKDQFLAVLSHELRNPLAAICNVLRIMRWQTEDGQVVQQVRDVIERQVSHLVRLVDDLLDASRITTGKIELRRQRVELGAVVETAVETIRPLIEAAGHELSVVLPPEPIYLEADLTRLCQVVANLLNNSARYTPGGGQIRLTAERTSREAVLRVRDTGIGIPADMLSHIFDMYAQAEPSSDQSQGGLGIGLTLAKRLVQLHGGTIEARSAGPGQGSEFTVRLPLASGDREDRRTEEPKAGDEQPAAPALRCCRILVVDDNFDAAESLAMFLRMTGHEVHTAHDGWAAVEAACTHRPEIVLLDIGLPGLSGYGVARQLRKQPWFEHGLLVAVSGLGREEDRHKSREAGFDLHVVKPIEPDKLQTLLAGALTKTSSSPPHCGEVHRLRLPLTPATSAKPE